MAAPRLARAMGSMSQPVDLVLDHVEFVWNDECLDVIVELALHLPVGSRLAIATRAEPPLPLARLRASGDVTEVGVRDLAMDHSEARALLQRAEVQLGPAELDEVIERTEGWPAGLYLAALALKGGSREESKAVRPSPPTKPLRCLVCGRPANPWMISKTCARKCSICKRPIATSGRNSMN